MDKIGFGGSCHWCTEAIFLSLKGVLTVQQGWIASDGAAETYSEAVIVTFDSDIISLEILVAVHLHTHSSTANHAMRCKYRSAVYSVDDGHGMAAKTAIKNLQQEFDQPIVTEVLPLIDFKLNKEEYLNYYYSDPTKPFCENIVNPKLKLLRQQFGHAVDGKKLSGLG